MSNLVHVYPSDVGQAGVGSLLNRSVLSLDNCSLCFFSAAQQGDQNCLSGSKEQHHFPRWKRQPLLQRYSHAGVPSRGRVQPQIRSGLLHCPLAAQGAPLPSGHELARASSPKPSTLCSVTCRRRGSASPPKPDFKSCEVILKNIDMNTEVSGCRF